MEQSFNLMTLLHELLDDLSPHCSPRSNQAKTYQASANIPNNFRHPFDSLTRCCHIINDEGRTPDGITTPNCGGARVIVNIEKGEIRFEFAGDILHEQTSGAHGCDDRLNPAQSESLPKFRGELFPELDPGSEPAEHKKIAGMHFRQQDEVAPKKCSCFRDHRDDLNATRTLRLEAMAMIC